MEYLHLRQRCLDLWCAGIPDEGNTLFVLTENAIEINSARTLLWSDSVSAINYRTCERRQAGSRSVLHLPCAEAARSSLLNAHGSSHKGFLSC